MPDMTDTTDLARQATQHSTEQALQSSTDQANQLSLEESLRQLSDALSQNTPHGLGIWGMVALLIGALIISWGLGRLMQLRGLRRVRKWLALIRVLLWAFLVLNVIFGLSVALSPQHWLPVGMLVVAILGISGLSFLRNVAAGLAMAFEAQFRVGDPVLHGGIQGEIVHFGARAVTLRADDGTLHQIPNESFAQNSVTRLESEGDAACDILVRLPAGVSPDRALTLARQAAFLTPLASPRHRPEVFLEMSSRDGQENSIELRIRGYAFDPAWRDAFSSDVVARIHDMLHADKSTAKLTQS